MPAITPTSCAAASTFCALRLELSAAPACNTRHCGEIAAGSATNTGTLTLVLAPMLSETSTMIVRLPAGSSRLVDDIEAARLDSSCGACRVDAYEYWKKSGTCPSGSAHP